MATLQEALNVDRSGYFPIERPAPSGGMAHLQLEPALNSMIRCPLPPVQVTPDSLRQYYLGGQVPQTRLLTPPNNVVGSSGGGTIVQQTTIVQTSASGSSSTSLASTQNSITTSILNPGDQFLGSLLLAKSFQLLSISSSAAARIELYGTAVAQNLDSSRSLDVAPAAGVFQNIISDLALDTNPFQYAYQNRMGSNGDSPQTSLIYITVTNLDVISEAFTITLVYVPLES